MKYKITNDIEKATHWIAYEDNRLGSSVISELVTPNKIYSIRKERCDFFNDEDYYIEDDKGELGMFYIAHKGDFIIMDTD